MNAAAVGPVIDAEWLRQLALSMGADDVAFVPLDVPELAEEAVELRRAFPIAHTLVSFVVRMGRENVRSPRRSVANRAFHDAGERAEHVADRLVMALEDAGVRALNPSMAFPMEMQDFPGRTWVISHKLVATASGLGMMGIHRNVIHPRFGNFVLLGTVALDRPVSATNVPLDVNPCLNCNLCVSACPVGAIHSDGSFDFQACYSHNYREFMGGFVDILGDVADAADRDDLARRLPVDEAVSLWQSLTYGANYKAAYCMAVCPAGTDVIGAYRDRKKAYVDEVVQPLRSQVEKVFVVRGSDAEDHVRKRYPHKIVRHVRSSLAPVDVDAFLRFAHLAFQRKRSKDVAVRLHFRFTGDSTREATIGIDQGRIEVLDGHVGERAALVRVDAATWVAIVAGRANPVWAVISGKLWVSGPLSALKAFQGCFLTA